jgi:HKD family nuclease
MSLKSLTLIKPLYLLPADDLIGEVLIPAFRETETAKCMMGFFSSEALASLAPGLATYINNSSHSFRLIVSPFLRPDDREAIEMGLKDPIDIVDKILSDLFISEELLQSHTLKCLSYLLCQGRLELKISLMKKALFHPKVWLFSQGERKMAIHGSSNMTSQGIHRNFEQISVSQSWIDPTQKYVVEKLDFQFERLWGGK